MRDRVVENGGRLRVSEASGTTSSIRGIYAPGNKGGRYARGLLLSSIPNPARDLPLSMHSWPGRKRECGPLFTVLLDFLEKSQTRHPFYPPVSSPNNPQLQCWPPLSCPGSSLPSLLVRLGIASSCLDDDCLVAACRRRIYINLFQSCQGISLCRRCPSGYIPPQTPSASHSVCFRKSRYLAQCLEHALSSPLHGCK